MFSNVVFSFSVVQRVAQQLSSQRRHQEARHPFTGRPVGSQPTKDVDFREVLQRGDSDPLQEKAPLFLHEQDERAQSLPRQIGEARESGREIISVPNSVTIILTGVPHKVVAMNCNCNTFFKVYAFDDDMKVEY